MHMYVCTRWFKYDWDCLCVNKSQFVPVIFKPPCMYVCMYVFPDHMQCDLSSFL